MGNKHVLDGPENLLLPVARQGAHAVKNGLGFADRPAALLWSSEAKNLLGRATERGGHGFDLRGFERDGASFPISDGLLIGADLLGELVLG